MRMNPETKATLELFLTNVAMQEAVWTQQIQDHSGPSTPELLEARKRRELATSALENFRGDDLDAVLERLNELLISWNRLRRAGSEPSEKAAAAITKEHPDAIETAITITEKMLPLFTRARVAHRKHAKRPKHR